MIIKLIHKSRNNLVSLDNLNDHKLKVIPILALDLITQTLNQLKKIQFNKLCKENMKNKFILIKLVLVIMTINLKNKISNHLDIDQVVNLSMIIDNFSNMGKLKRL